MGKLAAVGLQYLIQPGWYSDGNGLYFVVWAGGSRSWVQRITIDGKRRDLGLGGFPAVGLAEARRKAEANKKDGKAKKAQVKAVVKETRKSKSTAPTFRQVASEYHAQASVNWKSEKTAKNWMQRAERYIFPRIGNTPVDEISRADILGILNPVWTAKAETGRRLLEIIRTVMDRAADYEFIPVNPAARFSRATLPPMPKCRSHHKAVPYPVLRESIDTVDGSTAFRSTKLAVKFLVLTAARTTEALGATWDEIDLDAATWTVPAERMKQSKDHRVALSSGAIAVLREAATLGYESPWVFPNERTPHKCLSDMSLSTLFKRLEIPGVPHGLRATFATWGQEKTDHDFAIREMALSHEVGNAVTQSYQRSDLLDRRRRLMQDWSDYLFPELQSRQQ